MSRFYGRVSGSAKTEATRLGTGESGINTYAQGWVCGVHVFGYVDETGRDCFRVERTGGSRNEGKRDLLCVVRADGS